MRPSTFYVRAERSLFQGRNAGVQRSGTEIRKAPTMARNGSPSLPPQKNTSNLFLTQLRVCFK